MIGMGQTFHLTKEMKESQFTSCQEENTSKHQTITNEIDMVEKFLVHLTKEMKESQADKQMILTMLLE
ncbi:hypothetical protein S83_048146 [Arachis hypogaea]